MALVQFYIFIYSTLTLFTILSFFSGIIIYTNAILVDIKSLFNRIENLLKSNDRNAAITVLKLSKEAISVHVRVYRWFPFLIFHSLFTSFFHIKAIWSHLQLCAAIGRHNECGGFHNSITEHYMHVLQFAAIPTGKFMYLIVFGTHFTETFFIPVSGILMLGYYSWRSFIPIFSEWRKTGVSWGDVSDCSDRNTIEFDVFLVLLWPNVAHESHWFEWNDLSVGMVSLSALR